MSEAIASPDRRILPEEMCWPVALADRYTQRGYWQPETLGQLILQWRQYGDRTALIEPGRSWSYHQLINQACRFAGELRRRGMQSGEMVVIQLPNGADFVVALFATILNGAVPVLMLPAHRQREILHVVELAQARWFLSDAEQAGVEVQSLRAKAPDCHSLLSTAEQRFAASQAPAMEGLPPGDAPQHIALLLLSGGTTGLPKLIPRTHADYYYNFRASAALCHVQPDDRYLAVLSMAHNFPLACPGILGIFSRGGCVVVPTTVAAEDAFDAIHQHRVTLTALVPSLVTLWLEAAEWEQPDLSSLRLVQVGGARLGADTARQLLARWGCQLQQVFGMAEGLLNYTRLDDSPELITTTQGRPLCDDDEIRVVDEQGLPVISGQAGELLVRGPYTIRGYYRAPEHNRQAFAAGGFYRSGDRVRQLPGGELLVEGRTRDTINRHGESVAADEIEECLRAHPRVRDVTVLADAAGEQQEAIHAVVIAHSPLTLAEMRAFLEQQQVAPFKWPDRLTLVDAFPLTPIGKINKQALAAQLAVEFSGVNMTDTRTELRLNLPADRTLAAIVSLIRQNPTEDYYVYERPPCWYVGLGKRASLTILPDGSQAITESEEGCRTAPVTSSLAHYARQFRAQHASAGQRVFGMAGFNYAACIRGIAFTAGEWPLLSLLVPRDELVFDAGEVMILAHSADQCQHLARQLQDILPAPAGGALLANLTAEGKDYQHLVTRALEEIAAGEYTKVIVSRALELAERIDMPATLWRGRMSNTPARSFLLQQGTFTATGFSPEMVVTVEQDIVTSEPLAGTRALSGSAGEDAYNRAELQSDSKEIVEHVISVKAAIGELETLCVRDSVAVTDLMSVRERGSVQHLGSQVCGKLASGRDAWDAFDVLFPAITASGIPKLPALAAILRLEAVPRELYSGAILMLEGDRSFEAALVLRSAFQDARRSWLQAGAGVIAQSNALRELTETCEKLSSVAPYLVVSQAK